MGLNPKGSADSLSSHEARSPWSSLSPAPQLALVPKPDRPVLSILQTPTSFWMLPCGLSEPGSVFHSQPRTLSNTADIRAKKCFHMLGCSQPSRPPPSPQLDLMQQPGSHTLGFSSGDTSHEFTMLKPSVPVTLWIPRAEGELQEQPRVPKLCDKTSLFPESGWVTFSKD